MPLLSQISWPGQVASLADKRPLLVNSHTKLRAELSPTDISVVDSSSTADGLEVLLIAPSTVIQATWSSSSELKTESLEEQQWLSRLSEIIPSTTLPLCSMTFQSFKPLTSLLNLPLFVQLLSAAPTLLEELQLLPVGAKLPIQDQPLLSFNSSPSMSSQTTLAALL